MNGSNWLKRRTIIINPRHKSAPRKKIASRTGSVIFTAAKKTCTVIGAIVLISACISVVSTSLILKGKPLPEESVLLWNIEGSLEEVGDESVFPAHLGLNLDSKPTLHQIVHALDAAARDERIRALVVSFRSGRIQLAHIEELRAAVERFRAGGKPALFYAADMDAGLGLYYLASAFGEIWMQPVGSLVMAGINMEEPYVKALLDRLGVSATFFRREEYKTAYENVTEAGMSAANREMMTKVVGELGKNIASGIAASRGMSPANVKELVDTGLFTDKEALGAGLIDRLDYGDVLVSELKEKLTGDPENEELQFIPLGTYAGRIRRESSGPNGRPDTQNRKSVALIYVSGTILPDDTAPSSPLFMGGGVASARDISAAITGAADSGDIEAIVLRIDSPGGSPTASETIRHAIEKAKSEGQPVYVSMGPMAASGGYWVAASADIIFAQPSTLTGSIGVLGGKMVLSGMWDKIDVNWDRISWGANSGIMSPNTPYSGTESGRMNAMLDSIYDSFITIVAEGRGMSRERAEALAKGYVWTGGTALEAGLVDELGGLSDTMDFAARAMGLEDRTGLDITVMPRPETPAEKLLKLLGNNAVLARSVAEHSAVIDLIAAPLQNFAAMMQGHGKITYIPLEAP